MKKLTKKQKAQYPEFIAYIDFNSRGEEFSSVKGYKSCGLYVRAMEEKDFLSAIKRLERVIDKYGYAIYLVDLIGKTGREDEDGRPIYEQKLRCRVHLSDWEKDEDGNYKAEIPQWHLCDPKHCEGNDYDFIWYAWEDRHGELEYIRREED